MARSSPVSARKTRCLATAEKGEGTITADADSVYLANYQLIYRTDLLAHGKSTRPIYFARGLWDETKKKNPTSGMAVVNNELYVCNSTENKILVARPDLTIYYTVATAR